MSEENEFVWYQEIESGEWVQISKKTFLSMQHMIQKVQAMIDPDKKVKGTIQITGTMADDFERGEDLE